MAPGRSLEGDPDRPVWFLDNEIDCLVHEVASGAVLTGSLQAELDPGRYRARTRAFGDCSLGQPREVSAEET